METLLNVSVLPVAWYREFTISFCHIMVILAPLWIFGMMVYFTANDFRGEIKIRNTQIIEFLFFSVNIIKSF